MMQTFQPQQNCKTLEQSPLQVRRSASVELPWFWQAFLGFWNSSPREPRVHQKIDRLGNPYWRVYDPLHDCTIRFDNEQHLLVWLDEQHYHRARPNPWDID
jgi:hypothetical protein